MNINDIRNHNLTIGSIEKQNNNQKEKSISFKDFLKENIYFVSDMEKQANDMNLKFMSGEVENIHDVMIASQKADISIQAFIQVKNKIMDAYKEIMRIQI
ncbi:flagellar hook-basal body complex protein FliE [Tepidibacter formicigenes]|jgi:flagellar hook-basal body complex protein FliE|uniref:Flagellar hook-basal body complex protein FliE n=1 Tax=Tepidibacter formicigenes DSM 15518 TaxID=1123349 RepID=A0A1M6J8U3_9FIRM|nr:flagellar hook-basal body complex protein FliE [Tepidibacter formicigenes]SHJ43084.1 flagellar hook-basal body complex protein FliE [Tepidibacter formicigenes DSM 15518]